MLQLGDEGSGGSFDQILMSKLFVLGLVEVQSIDRHLILTKAGREVYVMLKDAIRTALPAELPPPPK